MEQYPDFLYTAPITCFMSSYLPSTSDLGPRVHGPEYTGDVSIEHTRGISPIRLPEPWTMDALTSLPHNVGSGLISFFLRKGPDEFRDWNLVFCFGFGSPVRGNGLVQG